MVTPYINAPLTPESGHKGTVVHVTGEFLEHATTAVFHDAHGDIINTAEVKVLGSTRLSFKVPPRGDLPVSVTIATSDGDETGSLQFTYTGD